MIALAHEDVTMWWVAIGMGFVVVLVVIALLTLLISLVNDIDRNVKLVWGTATRVARNTATSWMLKQTGSATAALAAETARHVEALQSLAGPAPTLVGARASGGGGSSTPGGAARGGPARGGPSAPDAAPEGEDVPPATGRRTPNLPSPMRPTHRRY
jgi:hypothetical protein